MATENSKPPSEISDKFMLRLHVDGLRKQLKIRAAENERTLNAEILYLIKRGLAADQQQPQGAQACPSSTAMFWGRIPAFCLCLSGLPFNLFVASLSLRIAVQLFGCPLHRCPRLGWAGVPGLGYVCRPLRVFKTDRLRTCAAALSGS